MSYDQTRSFTSWNFSNVINKFIFCFMSSIIIHIVRLLSCLYPQSYCWPFHLCSGPALLKKLLGTSEPCLVTILNSNFLSIFYLSGNLLENFFNQSYFTTHSEKVTYLSTNQIQHSQYLILNMILKRRIAIQFLTLNSSQLD